MIPFKLSPLQIFKAAVIAALFAAFIFMYYRVSTLNTSLETANKTIAEQQQNIDNLVNAQTELKASIEDVRKRFNQLDASQKKSEADYQKASDILQALKAHESSALTDPNILKQIQQESDDYERQAQCSVGYLSSCS